MAEGPIREIGSVDRMLTAFMRYPQKRLCFFTIKDNTHLTKWDKIGKINDWIRRYSNCYVVVRGMEGGTHFHGLAGIEPNRTPRFQKGIHMDIRYVNDPRTVILPDYKEMAQSADLRNHIIDTKFEEQSGTQLEPAQQECLRMICTAVKAYWNRLKIRRQVAERRTKKEQSILRILGYLEKNLLEPREEELEIYVDYISKY